MNDSVCDRLDDYLANGLAGPEQAAFAAHLPDCPACRRAVAEQERLDRLLAGALAQAVAVPPGLLERVERRLQAARQRRLGRWLSGLAAAAVLGLAGWLLSRRPPPVPVPPAAIVQKSPAPPTSQAPASRPPVRVEFAAGSDVIAVPLKTDNPNVTVIWLYPVVKTARRPAAAPSQPPLAPGRRNS